MLDTAKMMVKIAETIPQKNADYEDLSYWNERYKNEDSYEWCKEFKDFQHLIRKYIKLNDRIMILGCGNSQLGVDLFDAGYKDITNVDYSEVVIDKMKKKYSDRIGMKWIVSDMRDLMQKDQDAAIKIENDGQVASALNSNMYRKFRNGEFDVVIEKGTLDVLFVNEKSPWDISADTEKAMEATLSGISNLITKRKVHSLKQYRISIQSVNGSNNSNYQQKSNTSYTKAVLDSDSFVNSDCEEPGRFISVTFAQPHFRKKYYENEKYNWNVKYETFGDAFHYFFYVSTKRRMEDA